MPDPFFTYANPIIQPSARGIDYITNGEITEVGTSAPHLYKTGLIVRIFIPEKWEGQDFNQLYAPITVISPIAFTMPINSVEFDVLGFPLAMPLDRINSIPQAIPIAEVTSQLDQAAHNIYG